MKLYYHPISTYSQKVLIALYEKDMAFEREIVQLMDPDARDRYREIYPLGKVPVLALDTGRLIPESTIIIEYLEGLGGTPLIGGDADQQRQVRFNDRMLDLYLNENVAALLFQGMKAEEQRDQERIARANFQIDTMYSLMEHELGEQEFAAGSEFSMADCAAAPAVFYAQQVASFDGHENICAYWDRLNTRPSIQKVQEEAAPAIAAFMEQSAA